MRQANILFSYSNKVIKLSVINNLKIFKKFEYLGTKIRNTNAVHENKFRKYFSLLSSESAIFSPTF
jgi:hypothetical protein